MTSSRIESPAFASDTLRSFERASSREWLETNGLGGYSSSSLSEAHTRGYHGLLVAATAPPTVRHVLLSRLDETVHFGDFSAELSTRAYHGAVNPRGHEHLVYYQQESFPTFTYEVGGVCLTKTISMPWGLNCIIVTYDLMLTEQGSGNEVSISLSPFFAYRGYHERQHAHGEHLGDATFKDGTLRFSCRNSSLPDTFIQLPDASWSPQPDWFYNFYYSIEAERGLPCTEDLFTPGRLLCKLRIGTPLRVMISAGSACTENPEELIDRERVRRGNLARAIPQRDALTDLLVRASDQFLVKRSTEGRTIIAGYPWFTDWGRDTMISLPGICLTTRRYSEAKAILTAFLKHEKDGLIPNRFPDIGEEPEYNTVDGTLWYFVAAWQYVKHSRDVTFAVNELLPFLLYVIKHHQRGTRYNIRMTEDGLLSAGSPNTQLTWMDARVSGHPVTPRYGKAVEINALWYNALRITAELCKLGEREDEREKLLAQAKATANSFTTTFWNEDLGYLYDYVADETKEASLRPNQLLALSLPFPLMDGARALSILESVTTKLLTPRGLRTLTPDSPSYRGYYSGGGEWRDGAYHQGTVWPWLLGPYLTALARFDSDGKTKVQSYIERFAEHLSEAGIGTCSEIFDGNHPFRPHGCPAQAWSVAEILRVYVEDVKGIRPAEL